MALWYFLGVILGKNEVYKMFGNFRCNPGADLDPCLDVIPIWGRGVCLLNLRCTRAPYETRAKNCYLCSKTICSSQFSALSC